MESLQIAQVLADLSALQNTEAAAASSLLKPLQQPTRPTSVRRTTSSTLPSHLQPSLSRTNTPPVQVSATFPEKNSATSSGAATPNSSGTPRTDRGNPIDSDEALTRARTLLELFEKRGQFKQMGDQGLLRSKERVDAVAARYAKRDMEDRERVSRSPSTNKGQQPQQSKSKYLFPRI